MVTVERAKEIIAARRMGLWKTSDGKKFTDKDYQTACEILKFYEVFCQAFKSWKDMWELDLDPWLVYSLFDKVSAIMEAKGMTLKIKSIEDDC